MRFRILFLLLVVSGSYSNDEKPQDDILRLHDTCVAKCSDANVNKMNDMCLLMCNQTQSNVTVRQIISKISVRCLERNGTAVNNAHVRFTPLEERSVKYLVACRQKSGSYYMNISIDSADEQTEGTFNTIFWGLPLGADFNVSVQPISLNVIGDEVSTNFSTPSRWEDESNDTMCAPLKVEGLDAKVTNQVENLSYVTVTWNRPYIIPDFFVINVTSNDPEAGDSYFQNISGTATETVFFNVTISQEFNVSIRAWAWGEEGEEISEQYLKPEDSLVITALTIMLSLPFLYIMYAYFRHRRQTQMQKRIESLKKSAIEVQSYAVLSENDTH